MLDDQTCLSSQTVRLGPRWPWVSKSFLLLNVIPVCSLYNFINYLNLLDWCAVSGRILGYWRLAFSSFCWRSFSFRAGLAFHATLGHLWFQFYLSFSKLSFDSGFSTREEAPHGREMLLLYLVVWQILPSCFMSLQATSSSLDWISDWPTRGILSCPSGLRLLHTCDKVSTVTQLGEGGIRSHRSIRHYWLIKVACISETLWCHAPHSRHEVAAHLFTAVTSLRKHVMGIVLTSTVSKTFDY